MAGSESVRYSLRSITNRKARSLLTVFSISIGITTIFIFISFGLGLYNYIQDSLSETSADKLIIQARGVGAPGLDTTFALLDKDLRAVEKTSGVIEASGVYFKIGEVEFRNERIISYVMGYDPKVPLIMEVFNIDIFSGRELKSGDSKKAVLGYNYLVADKIFSKPVRLNDKIEVQGTSLKVVGFYEPLGNPQDDSNVYLVDDDIETIFSDQNNSYGWIVARVNPNDIETVSEKIEKSLRKSRDLEEGKEDFFVQTFQDMIESFLSILNIVVGFILVIAFISVIVSAVNTANTMITSVLERIKEIGVIKAIGAKNSEIFLIFLFESSFLGFIAGSIGVLVGWGISTIGGNVLESIGFGFLAPAFPPALFIGSILFAVLTGAISGVVPAWNASRINVVDALRYE